MKRTIVCASLALALALPASASATAFHSRQGTAPDLAVSFTVRTFDGDPVKIKRFKANGIPLTCTDGTSGTTTQPVRFPGDLKVNDKRTFHGKGKLGPSTMVVKGKVRRKGRARGTLRLLGPSATTPDVTCDSGKVGWRVRRD